MRRGLLGLDERLGQIVSYADDFVILCASWRQAKESLVLVSRWLEKLGLAIHPTKTRLCHAREEPFDFLGYTFGPARHWQTGKRMLLARPSKKAQKRLKEKVNTLLIRATPHLGLNCVLGSTDFCRVGPNTSASALQVKPMMPSAGM